MKEGKTYFYGGRICIAIINSSNSCTAGTTEARKKRRGTVKLSEVKNMDVGKGKEREG